MLLIRAGIMNGDTLRGPRSMSTLCWFLNRPHAADAGADDDTDAVGFLLGHVELRVGDGLPWPRRRPK